MPIEVLKPGLSTTVQDRGRIGYYDVGIPPSGALDQYSLLAANLLVGNADEVAALECVYLGPKLRFTAPTAAPAPAREFIVRPVIIPNLIDSVRPKCTRSRGRFRPFCCRPEARRRKR